MQLKTRNLIHALQEATDNEVVFTGGLTPHVLKEGRPLGDLDIIISPKHLPALVKFGSLNKVRKTRLFSEYRRYHISREDHSLDIFIGPTREVTTQLVDGLEIKRTTVETQIEYVNKIIARAKMQKSTKGLVQIFEKTIQELNSIR